jgi:transmembrane sensor
MSADRTDILDQAIGWHVRLPEADERGWTDFIEWMEASPEHAAAFDRMAVTDRVLGHAEFPAPAPEAGNDNAPVWRRWYVAGGGMVAAAAVAAAMLPSLLPRAADPLIVATANGERRTLSLEDGTRIEMSGGSAIRLDPANPRMAALDRGEAVFHVKHDAARPFTVDAGGVAIRDLGTVFNVSTARNQVRVAVAEGSVMFRPDHEALTLGAGETAVLDRKTGAVDHARVSADLVGGWRSGSLSFESATIADVAASMTRLYGTDLEIEPGLSARPFTGMVRFTGAGDRDVPHLAELIGAESRREGNRWVLSSKP